MIKEIITFLKNKNIAILGFGKEGKSSYAFIRKYLPNQHLYILDKNKIDLLDENITIISGECYLDNLDLYDVIIKTPGISFKNMDLTNIKDKIYSQLELMLKFNRHNCIGITGTKGKSTTSTLIYKVLKNKYKDTILVGNIGIPIFDEIENMGENTLVVVEMSSHQLEFVNTSAHIGIVLNLYEDHLDHAGNVKHYHEIKMNMFKYMTNDDLGIYCMDNECLKKYVDNNNYSAKLLSVSLDGKGDITLDGNKVVYNNEILYVDDNKRKIVGNHNLENIMIVCLIAKLFKIDLDITKNIIDEFIGLEHRLELVDTINGITYYNDAIATIPEATKEGIIALKNVNTLILGGMDRGINYDDFIKFLSNSNVDNLICMPTTGIKIGNEIMKINKNKNVIKVNTLKEAVEIAKKITKKNTICLLSPAASSYEYFKNFEEKGNCYKDLVKEC